jgi:hypothetical protein
MTNTLRLILIGIVSASCLTQAKAASITTLYNTGVNNAGAVLPDGTIGDPHYSLIAVPAGTVHSRVRTATGGYPIPPYFGDDNASAWIGPNNDAQLDGAVGNYTYRTTFDLTGFDPSTASITGGWSSDNNGVMILLNGVNTGNLETRFNQFEIGFAPFTVASGFVSGVNTLDFVVYNGGGPTSLRVEMTGTANQTVPDGGSTVLLLGGVLSLLGLVRRKMS